jgi:superfamily II helicase
VEEFWSLKHLNSPTEASKLKENEASSTEKMLAAACVGSVTEIGEEVEGPSMWKG